MEAQLVDSQVALQLAPLNAAKTAVADSQKAWHVFAVLLSLGRPAPPEELASKCTLFGTTPERIRFLCDIPDSPLHLTRNLYVTISAVGYVAIAQFVSNAEVNFTISPRLGFGFESGQLRRVCGAGNEWRTYYRKRKRIISENEYMPPVKRKVIFENFSEEKTNEAMLQFHGGKQSDYAQAYVLNDKTKMMLSSDTPILAFGYQGRVDVRNMKTSWVIDSNARFSSGGEKIVVYKKEDTDMCENGGEVSSAYQLDYGRCLSSLERKEVNRPLDSTSYQKEFCQVLSLRTPGVSLEADDDEYNASSRKDFNITSCFEAGKNVMPDTSAQAQMQATTTALGIMKMVEEIEEPVIDIDRYIGYIGKFSSDATKPNRLHQEVAEDKATTRTVDTLPFFHEEKLKTPLKSLPTFEANMFSTSQKSLGKSPPKSKIDLNEALNCKPLAICKTPDKNKDSNPPMNHQQPKRGKKPMLIQQKKICDEIDNSKEQRERRKENREKSLPVTANKQMEHKKLPDFESYIVEEEEGSGGYGTVYRARRKSDGSRFAIKCPHGNANRHHVQNEVKMLEKFGGYNFVIKCEGSFKTGNSDCLVLEHVDHDRPEVLKREIDISQLQWYGYCLFKALAGLHKQGIVHRDVKPGNFLFSRKSNKGYLIDFNLAMDMQKKYGITERTKSFNDFSFNPLPLPDTKSLPPTRTKKLPSSRILDSMNQEPGKISKSILSLSRQRRTEQAKNQTNVTSRNGIKSQGADGSGITSAKDATSNKTPSAERLRGPIPTQGRKELLSLVQQVHCASREAPNVPASKRKRVAAPPGNGDRNFIHLSPMPLRSAGVPVAGSGLLKNRSDCNQKREGPCAGTKGFRAPEVLIRSLHQGPKLDIWSAGVTLLYLIMGRTPFGGEPEQNLKEIAKVRGCEDLWEVTKLHNRESSLPADLLDIKYLPSVSLREWCKLHTRRPDFFHLIPESLFDLTEKCLTVNPRVRISAEEALKHEFLVPCQVVARKLRLSRQGLSSLYSGNTTTRDSSGKQIGQVCEQIS